MTRTRKPFWSRSLLLAHGLVLLASAGLAAVPLFNLVGFEFAAALAVVLAYTCGLRTCAVAHATRSQPPGSTRHPFPKRELGRVVLQNLSLLATPLVFMTLHSVRVPTCNWSEGLLFYLLLPVPAVLYGTALGFALGLAFSVRRARLLFFVWSLLTYAFALSNMLFEPPKFAYNAFVGYFPGPIYDRQVPLTSSLVWARVLVVVQALWVVLLVGLAWDGARLRGRHLLTLGSRKRAGTASLALVLLLFLGITATQAASLGLRIDRDFIQKTLGGHIETEHCHLYYDRETFPEPRAQELAQEHEFRYSQLRDFFGIEPTRKIRSYVYASAAQKKRLMGAGNTSFEDAFNDEFHINATQDAHPVLTHEMAHLFAAALHPWMPICPVIGIHEGIAVAAEWKEEGGRLGMTPDIASAAMRTLGLLPDLRSALGAFGFWTQPGARAYTAAGSFVHYLVQVHGMERFRVLWPWGDFESAYGTTRDTLLGEWESALDRVVVDPIHSQRAEHLYRRPALFAQPCAREMARLESEASRALVGGHAARAGSLYTRLLEIEPTAPRSILGLGRARLLQGDFDTASTLASELLESDRFEPAVRRLGWRLAGDTAWRQGQLAKAESCYTTGKTLGVFADETRAYEVLLTGLRHPDPWLRDYLTGTPVPDDSVRTRLEAARDALPEALLVRYLLGRHLYQQGLFEAAADELRAAGVALDLGLLVTLAAREYLGRSLLRSGQPQLGLQVFETLLQEDLETSDRLRLEDWRDRCDWTLRQRVPDRAPTLGTRGLPARNPARWALSPEPICS